MSLKSIHKKPAFWVLVIALLLLVQVILITPGSPPDVSKLNDPVITTTPQTQATTPQELLQGEKEKVVPVRKLDPITSALMDVIPYLVVAAILTGSVAYIAGPGTRV